MPADSGLVWGIWTLHQEEHILQVRTATGAPCSWRAPTALLHRGIAASISATWTVLLAMMSLVPRATGEIAARWSAAVRGRADVLAATAAHSSCCMHAEQSPRPPHCPLADQCPCCPAKAGSSESEPSGALVPCCYAQFECVSCGGSNLCGSNRSADFESDPRIVAGCHTRHARADPLFLGNARYTHAVGAAPYTAAALSACAA